MCPSNLIILCLVAFELSSAFDCVSRGLNTFFTTKASRPFESVVTICPDPSFCAEDTFCQMIQSAFDSKPKATFDYSVLRKQKSFPGALVILLDFEEEIDAMEPNSFFSHESLWLIFVPSEEKNFSAVLQVLEGLDSMQLNSDVKVRN